MNQLKQIRKGMGIKANAISELLAVRPNTVCTWEHNEPPKPQHVAAYSYFALRDDLRAYIIQLKRSDTTKAVGETLEGMILEVEGCCQQK